MQLSNTFTSFLKGLGFVLLTALLAFIGNEANLSFLSPNIALIISGLAVWLESTIEGKTGMSLFGAVRKV